jgi:hypothetical protein
MLFASSFSSQVRLCCNAIRRTLRPGLNGENLRGRGVLTCAWKQLSKLLLAVGAGILAFLGQYGPGRVLGVDISYKVFAPCKAYSYSGRLVKFDNGVNIEEVFPTLAYSFPKDSLSESFTSDGL